MNRREARVKALQSLFQVNITGTQPEVAIANLLDEEEQGDTFLTNLVTGSVAHQDELDHHIKTYLDHWSLARIGHVDRNILRLAVFELLYMDDIPRNVTINEAIEIAKLFGGDDSGSFVNGILANIAQSVVQKTGGDEHDS